MKVFSNSRRRRCQGFTLMEVVMAALALSVLTLGVATFFDSTRSLYSQQSQVTEMQQGARGSQRELIRMARMLGRGGFPTASDDHPLPSGLAIEVWNNVDDGTSVLDGGSTFEPPEVVGGTDVLTLRGVFTSPVFQIDHTQPSSFVRNPDDDREADLVLQATTSTGVPQDLSLLIDTIERSKQDGAQPIREAILLVSPRDSQIYGVAELDPLRSDIEDPSRIRLRLLLSNPDDDSRLANDYETLCPGGEFPQELFQSRVGFAGVLEERRYFVRKDFSIAGDPLSRPTPRLSRARLYPATEIPHGHDSLALSEDLAREVFDLQVALGFDSSNAGTWSDDENGEGIDDQIYEAENGTDDDWLYNSSQDRDDRPPWGGLAPEESFPKLYYLRIGTLSRSRLPIRNRMAPSLRTLEDHNFEGDVLNTPDERRYQRILTQTTIDMRNLG